ncbi:GGDEF domain-containing protein [Svornostia abyssi]|uniref:GGDEF domain-containing protein n=1 Tax=Svornostia abyssi TaxID=2898438 RepID=A0ABY5PPP4_9ACTN|nr:GGDEF domain-containing protein [Parviterribacteraceae bacterium J379]
MANRLLLCDRLAQSFARRLRHGGEILVAIIDVDQFKAINDTHGHEVGDTVLIEVAHRLTRTLRGEDTVARLGGDEFAIVAEVADQPTAELLLSRLRAGLADLPLPDGKVARATIGAAPAQAGDDVSTALERADRAMYAAKRGVSA